MKKRIAVFLLFVLMLVSAGCGNTPAQAQSTPAPAAIPASTAIPEAAPEQAAFEKAPAEPTRESKSLVVVFSCTGTTRGVAEKLANVTGADLYEIIPAVPYTEEDLNYNDRSTRATMEQNTPDARPEIAEDISLDGVTTLYLGYPIWWGQAPRIMSTFVESHDFTGIIVVPFCTSGGSGAGRTGETLGEQAGTGTFLTSTRFSSSVTESELQSWIDSHK